MMKIEVKNLTLLILFMLNIFLAGYTRLVPIIIFAFASGFLLIYNVLTDIYIYYEIRRSRNEFKKIQKYEKTHKIPKPAL